MSIESTTIFLIAITVILYKCFTELAEFLGFNMYDDRKTSDCMMIKTPRFQDLNNVYLNIFSVNTIDFASKIKYVPERN